MESTLLTTLNPIDEANISGGTGKGKKYKPKDKHGDKGKYDKYKPKDKHGDKDKEDKYTLDIYKYLGYLYGLMKEYKYYDYEKGGN
jgi:hypothetical protein